MILNPSKTTAICFSSATIDSFDNRIFLDGSEIPFVDKIKCLGFTLNKFLNWDDHINVLIRNVNFYIMRLNSLSYHIPVSIKKIMANAILVSRFLCGIEVFSGTSASNMNKLRICFNNVVRFVYGVRRFEHISSYVKDFIGCSFDNFVAIRMLFLLYKVIYYGVPHYLLCRFNFLPSQRLLNLDIPRFSREIMRQSFTVRAVSLYNQFVPRDLRNFSKPPHIFKNILKTIL